MALIKVRQQVNSSWSTNSRKSFDARRSDVILHFFYFNIANNRKKEPKKKPFYIMK